MSPQALKTLSCVVLGVIFVGAGVLHLVKPGMYLRIMPPWLPAPALLVLLSGIAEIVGGVGLFIPAVRVAAGWGLVALLVAVFPANLHMALHADSFSTLAPAWALWVRLPLQGVLIAWVLWSVSPSSL